MLIQNVDIQFQKMPTLKDKQCLSCEITVYCSHLYLVLAETQPNIINCGVVSVHLIINNS